MKVIKPEDVLGKDMWYCSFSTFKKIIRVKCVEVTFCDTGAVNMKAQTHEDRRHDTYRRGSENSFFFTKEEAVIGYNRYIEGLKL